MTIRPDSLINPALPPTETGRSCSCASDLPGVRRVRINVRYTARDLFTVSAPELLFKITDIPQLFNVPLTAGIRYLFKDSRRR
jgi:hypothetical protein